MSVKQAEPGRECPRAVTRQRRTEAPPSASSLASSRDEGSVARKPT